MSREKSVVFWPSPVRFSRVRRQPIAKYGQASQPESKPTEQARSVEYRASNSDTLETRQFLITPAQKASVSEVKGQNRFSLKPGDNPAISVPSEMLVGQTSRFASRKPV